MPYFRNFCKTNIYIFLNDLQVTCLTCHCGFHSYKYNTFIQVFQNDSVNLAACADPLKTEVPEIQIEPSVEDNKGKTVDYIPDKSFWLWWSLTFSLYNQHKVAILCFGWNASPLTTIITKSYKCVYVLNRQQFFIPKRKYRLIVSDS